jgi:hypothetical protein
MAELATKDTHPSSSFLNASNPFVFKANQVLNGLFASMAEGSEISENATKFPILSKIISLGCIAAEPLWVNIGIEQIKVSDSLRR